MAKPLPVCTLISVCSSSDTHLIPQVTLPHDSTFKIVSEKSTNMLVYQIIFLTVTSLLHACSAYDTSDPNIKCVPKIQTGRANCKTAYGKILYEPDSTLDVFEMRVERIQNNCVVRVDKPFDLKISKQAIEAGFDKMLSHCKEHPGTYVLPDFKGVTLSTRPRNPYPIIEDDTPSDKLICYEQKDHTLPEDCARAFSGLRTRHDGLFVIDGERTMTATYNSWGTCNVAIVSSDTSALTVNKEDATAKIYQIISTCNGKVRNFASGFRFRTFLIQLNSGKLTPDPLYQWGSIAMKGGVKGRNGRAIFTLSAKLK
ncbi:hypothetical protein MJO28_005991 [Puccinia striiformis f. sp. tritici]|uniref:Uncharacterized protein n=1 Tax=Puccinia striiformis f. sp. tritici TaxID=168172 RepID=A0ACC0EG74_9BASI|nr:hypothetical protein MJO28_005991 [Puccinia striiformis f. sp. tritici]